MINIEQNESQINSPTIESIVQSNTEIFEFLTFNNFSTQSEDFSNLINNKIFQDKIKFLLKYYKPRGNEEISTLSAKKIIGKYPITQMFKDLINYMSDNLVK